MDQHRLLTGAVGGGVLEIEPLGHVEVELNGRHLPRPSQRVLGLHRDLGTVEGRTARIRHQLQPGIERHLLQRLSRFLPDLVGPNEFRLVLGRQF
ncbi:Uncharacterised protein [Mycobacteroides abscessus subsp. abscessus]|nr:Uncharacterised protein [Mycobacteroides abscessus subsp. abscessus]